MGMKPKCYNREPRLPYYNANTGMDVHGRQTTRGIAVVFVDRCATWDGRGIGPNGEPYPVARGWDCSGCKWLPVQHSADARAVIANKVIGELISAAFPTNPRFDDK